MNINDIKQMKGHYENAIKESVATALSLRQDSIEVAWSLEQTNVNLFLYGKNNITRFSFQYTENDFIITTMSYQPVMENDTMVGIVAGTATINLATIEAIRDIIANILNEGVNEDNCEGEKDA